jgi:hypothetical protein
MMRGKRVPESGSRLLEEPHVKDEHRSGMFAEKMHALPAPEGVLEPILAQLVLSALYGEECGGVTAIPVRDRSRRKRESTSA